MTTRGFIAHVLLGVLLVVGPYWADAQTCAVPGRDGAAASAGTVNTH